MEHIIPSNPHLDEVRRLVRKSSDLDRELWELRGEMYYLIGLHGRDGAVPVEKIGAVLNGDRPSRRTARGEEGGR